MQDDFFVDAHDHADPPLNPYTEPIKEDKQEEKSQTFAEKLLEE